VFILIFEQFGQLQKRVKNKILKYLVHRIHPYLQEVMIYSMFISDVNNIRSYVLRASMTSPGKSNIWWFIFNSILTFLKKIKLVWFRMFPATFTIEIDIFQSYNCVISNIVFSSITYFFLLKDLLRNKNNSFLRVFFFLANFQSNLL
jgi:hypothetical protein